LALTYFVEYKYFCLANFIVMGPLSIVSLLWASPSYKTFENSLFQLEMDDYKFAVTGIYLL